MSMLVAVLFAAVGLNSQESAVQPLPEIQMRLIQLRIVDADGLPVSGAVVTPFGFRTRVDQASHWIWLDRFHGPKPSGTTDADGQISISIPKFVTEELEAGEVSWSVEHEDFVSSREDCSVDLKLVVITLSRGRRIAATAVDAQNGQPITTDLYALLNGSGSRSEWKLLENGTLLSRAMDWNRASLRVMHLPKDGPAKFSDTVRLDPEDRTLRVLLSEIPLHRGVRLGGQVDDVVPRPIVNGYAMVTIIDRSAGDGFQARGSWSDWVTIRPDGTFAFESLPRHSIAQVIAVCEGGISSQPTPQELTDAGMKEYLGQLESPTLKPQLFVLNEQAVQFTMRMDQSARCRVTVQTPDGGPLAGAEISFWPNQHWFDGGSQMLGDGFSSRIRLAMTDEQRKQTRQWGTRNLDQQQPGFRSPGINRLFGTTDENGVAVISGLPGGTDETPRTLEFVVEHAEFELPTAPHNPLSRSGQTQVVRGQTSEATVRMNPKGTEIIGK